MARFLPALRYYPGRFVGVCTEYNATFVEALKALPMRTWDAVSKTWWFPEAYLNIVEQAGAQTGVLSRGDMDFFKRSSIPNSGYGGGSHYALDAHKFLGLEFGAPRGLIDAAYKFWKREFETAGGVGDRLALLEEAYSALCDQEGTTTP